MENDKGMENKDVKKLAVRLVDQIRNARIKSKNKPSDSQSETESIKEEGSNPK